MVGEPLRRENRVNSSWGCKGMGVGAGAATWYPDRGPEQGLEEMPGKLGLSALWTQLGYLTPQARFLGLKE